MSIEEVYRFYVPRCSVCSYPPSPPSMWLLSLECGHLYCNYCIQELHSSAAQYQCLHEDSHFQACTPADRVVGRVEDFGKCGDVAELQELVAFFTSNVNYRGLGCRNPDCPRQTGWCRCPYDHSAEWKLPVLCGLYPACWREQWCPFRHELPPSPPSVPTFPHTLPIQSRGALHFLLKDQCKALNSLFLSSFQAIPNFRIHAYTRQPLSTPRWVYRSANAIIDFDLSDSDRLEKEWKGRVKSCNLDDGSEVFLSKMIQIRQESPADVIAIARVGRLASLEPIGEVEFQCTEDQFQALLTSYQHIEESRSFEYLLPAVMCLQLIREEGVSFRNEQVFGTNSALDVVFAHTLDPFDLYGFPEVFSQELPRADSQVVKQLADEAGVICFVGYAYGPMESLFPLLEQLKRYEHWVDMPADQSLVQQLTRDYGLIGKFGRLYGPKDVIRGVKEQLSTVETDLPPGITASDIEELRDFYPSLQAEEEKVRGNKEDIAGVLAHLADLRAKERFPTNLSYDTIQEVARKHGVQITGENLSGPKAKVGQALAELRAMRVAAIQVPSSAFTFHKPADWYLAQTQEEFLAIPLNSASPEYREVEKSFTATQKSPIIRIEKIQNRRMYTNFAYKHEAFSRVEGHSLELMLLFHGTSDTDPLLIARSDEGLDPRIGHGMWGTGSYYALKAAYSHSYCYKTQDGLAQMFLCEVMVGKFVELGPQDLKKPPKRRDKDGNFHSVKGKTAGSYIWITYEAGMSYPSFLITYQP